jgi:hypothetical protein
MTWDPSLDRLQAVLANMYTRDADIRRVATSAGLDPVYIDFDGPSISVWHQVLAEAVRRNRVEALIAVAQQEYGDNTQLVAAADEVRAAAAKAGAGAPGVGGTGKAGTTGVRRLAGPAWLAVGAGVLVVAIAAVLLVRSPGAAPGLTAAPTTAAPALANETVPPTATLTPAPSATWTPAEPTPFPPVTFDIWRVLDQPEMLAPLEYDYQQGVFPTETISDVLRLKHYEWGRLSELPDEPFALRFTLALQNTTDAPITLDLTERFYTLVDAQGRTGELVHFCCATRGGLLAPGREREILLVFKGHDDWAGKGGVSEAFLEVRGLLPVLNAVWRAELPVAAA